MTCKKLISKPSWLRIKALGVQKGVEAEESYELKNCPNCGSTLAVPESTVREK